MAADDDDRTAASRRRLEDFAARSADPSLRDAVDAATAEVVAAFARAGISPLLLKGPALAARLYRPGEQRRYIDIDLLLAPGDRVRAGRLLEGLGYENATARIGVDDFTGAVHADSWIRANGYCVDLHTRLAGCLAPPATAWERLRSGSDAIDVAGHRVGILGRAGLALHLATHVAQHGPDDLKAIGDLRRGIERWTIADWRAAADLASKLQATAAFGAGMRLLPEGAALAEDLGLPATPATDWEIRNRHERPRGASHVDAFARAEGVMQRARVVRRALLPRSRWIAWEFPWAAGSRLRVLGGYARHLARAPRWAVRSLRYRMRARKAR